MQGRHAFEPGSRKTIDLESFVADDHYLRKVDRVLELSFVVELTAECYSSGQGRPSIAPEIYFRMLLVSYIYGISSDRRLCEEVRYNLAYRWFCHLSLEDGTLLIVDTGPGHDNAAIGNTLVGTTLIAVLGGGIDEFWMEEVSVGRSTILDTGDEDDEVWINYTDTNLDLVLPTRGGRDNAFIGNSLVGGNLVTTLGNDSDDLFIRYVGVARLTLVNAGNGNDDVFVDFLDSNQLSAVMAECGDGWGR